MKPAAQGFLLVAVYLSIFATFAAHGGYRRWAIACWCGAALSIAGMIAVQVVGP